MGKRKGQRRQGSANARGTPYIFLAEDISIATADTAVNTTVITNSDNKKRTFILPRGPLLSCRNGAIDSNVFFIVRRVPSGYVAPTSVTIASGSATFIDVPNVLVWSLYNYESNQTTALSLRGTMEKRSLILYPGDSIVLQAIPSASSANLLAEAQMEYRLA